MHPRGPLLGTLLLFFAPACDVIPVNVGNCQPGQVADIGHRGPDGRPDPCHLQDPLPPSEGCPSGRTVPWPFEWKEPVWLWFGAEEQAPKCPQGSAVYDVHAGLFAPSACGVCSCGAPTGSCALPTTITASTTSCAAFVGGALTSLGPPAGWDGQCDASTQVPEGVAQAVIFGPLSMTEAGCTTDPATPAMVIPSSWQTFARACFGKGWERGLLAQMACIPAADPAVQDLRLCISRVGEHPCPVIANKVFTERHLFFEGVDDQRACSPCSCGSPTGSGCTATVSLYNFADPSCSGPADVQVAVSSLGPTCADLQPPGQAIGGKSAESLVYVPGVCSPTGGQPNGLTATATNPVTFCCQP